MKYFSTFSTTLSLLSVCALVSAHGYVQNVVSHA
jgi:vacuolar-type H+-ATPase subunit I/STV1